MSRVGGLLAIFVIIGIGSEVNGLRCWSCRRTSSNEECNEKGTVQTCKANQACINIAIRSNDGSSYTISKGCRRKNNPVCKRDTQNVGMYPMQCRDNKDQSVCQCCCDTDSCNGPQLECKDVVTCKRPNNPGNGRVNCPKSISYGTKCIVKCDAGYRRQGSRALVCTNGTDQGYWEPRSTPACLPVMKGEKSRKPVLCKAKLSAPQFGSMVCENQGEHRAKSTYNHVGTICAFKCDPGYFLSGAESVYCLPGGRWSIAAPECVKGRCQQPPQDDNRIDDCSDETYFGSTCVSRCKEGFRMIGSSTSTCNSINDVTRQGRWSENFGKCQRALCRPELIKPPNGNMKCRNKNYLGSLCDFTCDDGYANINEENAGVTQVECVQSGEVIEWNGPAPICVKITCPRLQMPQDGTVACVGDGSVGSTCTFSCNAGFDLVGVDEASQTSVCRDSGNGDGIGAWSVETITCAPIKCLPPREAPLNGKVYCTNENNVGSVCTFTCDAEYDMDDTTEWLLYNRCEPDPSGDGAGKWSADPATCSTRYYCQEAQVDPQNGSVDCDDEAYMGSVCQFSCDEGYELRGFDRITCRDIENNGDSLVEWTAEAPTCVPGTCAALWHDNLNVRAECSSAEENKQYNIGTKCTYSCVQPGYHLEGESEITCTAKNRWSANAAPRCFVVTCPPLDIIQNGNQPRCTNGNRYQSRCSFKCNPKYTLSHSDTLICDQDGEGKKVGVWDKEAPECTLSECLAIPPTPSMGTVTCSSGASIGSYCTLECAQGYAPKVQRIDCQKAEERTPTGLREIPQFLQLKDFCCAECRSEFHIAQIVDFRFNRNLVATIGYTKMLLTQLLGQENPAFFSTVAYSKEVDEDSLIPRVQVESSDTIDEIVGQIEKWNVEEQGTKSDTRSALDYGNDHLFEGVDSNAANFLIIAADDAPENVRRGSVSRIQSRGINIIVAASNNFAKLTWEKLLGGGENVVNLDANEIMKRIYDLAFKTGCSNMASRCV